MWTVLTVPRTFAKHGYGRIRTTWRLTNGQWYAALRVPMTSDGRTRNRLQMMDVDIEELQVLEREVLRLLSQYDNDQVTVGEVLEAVLHYDSYLARSSETESMRAKYKRTLVDRPWRSCQLQFLREPWNTHANIPWSQ